MREAYTRGVELKKAAQAYGATLIVNDRCDLALAVEADGAHLGQDDLPIAHARALLGPDRIIGVSTHNTEQVSAAAGTSADYLGFGPIFPPGSKSDHDPVVGVDGLRRVRALTALPVFAIGGIGPDHITTVYEAGADGVAVISAVWRSGDISQAIRVMLMRIAEADRRAR
jgi:thiamine-phosphate pyrophosphorylase